MHAIDKYFIVFYLTLYINCFHTTIISAQDRTNQAKLPIDTTYANQYVGVAESLIKIGRVDSALQYVEDAAAIYTNAKAWKRCAQAYNQIGFELYRISKYEEAYQLFSNAYQTAKENLAQPNPILATSCNHLGAVQAIKGNYLQALALHHEALTTQQRVIPPNKDAFVKTYLNIGNVYYRMGKYNKSLEYNIQSLDIQKNSSNTPDAELAETFNNIGLLNLRLENHPKALEYYSKSLETKQKIFFASHPKIATTYTDVALSYQKLEEFDKALTASDNALIILSSTFEETHPDFGVNYQLRGDIHFEQANYKEAIDFYKKALDNRLTANIKGGTEIAETYLRIAKTYEGQKYNPMGILPYIQKAVQALVYQFEEDDIFENPSLGNVLSEAFLLDAIDYKALMFKKLYNETGNKNHLEAALSNYQLAAQIILKSGLQYSIDNRKPITLPLVKKIFENGAKIAYQLSQITPSNDRNQYIDIGFLFSEQYKKYQQLLVLKSGEIQQLKGIDVATLQREKQLKIDFDFYHKMLLAEYQKGELANNNTIKYLQKQLERVQTNYSQLLEEYKKKHPQYFQLKYEWANTDAQQTQSYLQKFLPETAMVAYFMGDSLAYSYTFTKDTSFVKEFLIDTPLKNNIGELTDALSNYQLLTETPNESYQKYTTSAYAVFQSVLSRALSPIKNKAKNLVIIRDGNLNNVPFEALLTGVDSRQTPFNELQYLIKSHSLSYAFSTSHFLEDMYRKTSNKKAMLGMGMNYKLEEVNHSADSSIGKWLNELNYDWQNTVGMLGLLNAFENHKIYTNQDATKNQFLKSVNDYHTAHIAHLGFLNNESPLQSALLFYPEKQGESFSILQAYELYASNISLDLMVLNGLIVGNSNTEQHNGLTTWHQALSYAGCLSTLTSTWENDPNMAEILLDYFYKNLQQGMSKIEALGSAKRTFIEKHPDQAHPHHWSGHLLLGNPQSIAYPNTAPNWTLWAIAGGGILLLLFGLWMGTRFFDRRQGSSRTSTAPPYKEASSTFSNQSAASPITSTKVSSSNGDRSFASFTRFKKD